MMWVKVGNMYVRYAMLRTRQFIVECVCVCE